MTAIKKQDSEPANTNVQPELVRSREFLERQAFEAFKAFVLAFQDLVATGGATPQPMARAEAPASDVLTVDEAAEFLGVDRNTVYEYTTRGVIPHQRLGKRVLLRRGALVAWLDASLCKVNAATSV